MELLTDRILQALQAEITVTGQDVELSIADLFGDIDILELKGRVIKELTLSGGLTALLTKKGNSKSSLNLQSEITTAIEKKGRIIKQI